MASKGYVEAILNQLPSEQKKALIPAFQHVLDTWRLGDGDKALNASWYKFSSTTASVAGTEFSIVHGQNQIPSKLIPVLDLQTVGARIVPLTVSRAPDAHRVYLTSSSTSAPFLAYVEF